MQLLVSKVYSSSYTVHCSPTLTSEILEHEARGRYHTLHCWGWSDWCMQYTWAHHPRWYPHKSHSCCGTLCAVEGKGTLCQICYLYYIQPTITRVFHTQPRGTIQKIPNNEGLFIESWSGSAGYSAEMLTEDGKSWRVEDESTLASSVNIEAEYPALADHEEIA